MRKGNGWNGPVVGNLTTKNSNVWNSQIQQKTRESEFKRCHLSRKSSRKKYEGIIVQVRRCSGLFVCGVGLGPRRAWGLHSLLSHGPTQRQTLVTS